MTTLLTKIFRRNTLILSIFLLISISANAQKSPRILQGKGSDAIGYTVHHDDMAIVIGFGDQVDPLKRNRVIDFIDHQIFSDELEVPIVFFLGHEFEGEGVLVSVFIKGDRQTDPINGQRWFNLTELSKKAETFNGVYNLLSGNISN